MKYFIVIPVILFVFSSCKKQDKDIPPKAPGNVHVQPKPDVPTNKGPDKTSDDDSGKDESKVPKPQGKMEHGLRQGQWTFFHANGNKAAQGEYKQGLKDGKWIFWYDNGQKTAEGTFHMGKKVGKWIDYDEQGKKVSEQSYADGIRIYK